VWSSRRQSKVAIVYQRSAKHRRIDRKTMRWCGADFGLYPVSKRVKGMDLSVAGDVEAESKSEAKNDPLNRSGRGGRYARTIVVDGHHGTVREVFDGRWDAT
jgi:hypothetical protein